MNQLDVYYRALLDYKKAIDDDKDCVRLNNAFLSADSDSDKLVITKATCTIDEEWVLEIEKGLVFIEKAIKEDRQFILSQGEVVPIEKVRSVSKESVTHLAKHSDLITEYEEGEDIVPDKLYTVERLNDYTVYENRFLYMLLCYLRDFVSLRYSKIVEATNKYDAVLTLNKEFMIGKEKINYSVNLHDVRHDDEYLKEHNSAREIIDRIMLILKAVLSFLATPLMEYQAKVPMIKPPITKTNVLKMNNNFKGAVALYDYIISYNQPGYNIENQVTTISPFPSDMGSEFALAGGMLNFLSYEYSLGLKNDLKVSYDAEEERRKLEALKRVQDQISALNKRLRKAEITPEEYILNLEEKIKLFEKQCERMDALRKEIDRLKLSENKLMSDLKVAYVDISKLKGDLLAKEYENMQAVEAVQNECAQRMQELTDKLNAEKHEEITRLMSEITALQSRIAELMESGRLEQEAHKKAIGAANAKCDKIANDLERMTEAKRLAEARLKSYRFKNGDMTEADNFTDKESFDELENELEVFIKFYKDEWRKTKKRIRKDLLNIKNIRKQDEQK